MKRFCPLARLSACSLLLAIVLAHGAAVAAEEIETVEEGDVPLISSHECYSVGEEVAAQQGGTLARSTASMQNGQEMCIVVVLVPASDGQRPRRAEALIPLD